MNMTLNSDFGLTLDVVPTSLAHLPEMEVNGPAGSKKFSAAAVLQGIVPMQMLAGSIRAQGSNTMLNCLFGEGLSIGIAMSHADDHLAAVAFDLGEESMQRMAATALSDGFMRLLLSASDGSILVVPHMDKAYERILRHAASATPATFAAFANGVSSIAHALSRGETYVKLGLDAHQLKSVTLSVCIPGADEGEQFQANSNAASGLH